MNKVLVSIRDYAKKHLVAIIFYSLAAIAMLITSLSLLNWALAGDIEQVVSVKKATLVAIDKDNPPTLNEEYIVGQSFDTHGWALKFGKKTVMLNAYDIYEKYVTTVVESKNLDPDAEDYEKQLEELIEKLTSEKSKYAKAMAELEKVSINAEFSSANENTRAQIIYRKSDFVSYMAEIKGRALFVRTVEVESYPDLVDMSGDTPVLDENFEIYAILGNKPQTDAFGKYEEVRGGWKIKLADNMYTVSTVADTSLENFYTISFFCGDVSTGFSFYNAAGRSFVVSSKNNVVKYSTDAEGKELTLVVTERDSGYQLESKGKSRGSYIYTHGGVSTVYDFSYELTGTEEVFESDEVDEAHGENSYTARVDGVEFSALADVWQGAVVNGLIVSDHGYFAVIESAKRILEFDYIDNMFVLTAEPDSWSEGGVTIDLISAEIALKDTGAWQLVARYKPSNGGESAVTIDGNSWLYAAGDIVLEVPNFELAKTNGQSALGLTYKVIDNKLVLASFNAEIVFPLEGGGSSLHKISFSCEEQIKTVATLDGYASDDGVELYGRIVLRSDMKWQLSTGEDGESLAAVANGYWRYKKGDIILHVVNDENNVIFVPGLDDGETKTVTIARSAARGKHSYAVELNYAYTAGGDEPTYLKMTLSGATHAESVPTLTLYVSEYSMNPLLGTGNGYSRGVYIYTDRSGRTYQMTFYLQAWVWTYVPLSSSNGDVYAEASVSDYIKDDEGNWNTFRRGTMYADITFFERGVGFSTEYFSAPEEKWLNALLNL